MRHSPCFISDSLVFVIDQVSLLDGRVYTMQCNAVVDTACRLYFDLEFDRLLNPNHNGQCMVNTLLQVILNRLSVCLSVCLSALLDCNFSSNLTPNDEIFKQRNSL